MRLTLSLLIFLPLFAQGQAHKLVFAKLAKNKIVNGEFKQTRKIISLDTTLKSSGNFNYELGKKLVWDQKTPLASQIIIFKDKIIQKVEGIPEQKITKKDKPSIFKMNEVIFSIMSGEDRRLTKLFKIESEQQKTGWLISLVPKEALMKKIFKTITLSGDSYIKIIKLNEKNGNSTEIIFNVSEKTVEK